MPAACGSSMLKKRSQVACTAQDACTAQLEPRIAQLQALQTATATASNTCLGVIPRQQLLLYQRTQPAEALLNAARPVGLVVVVQGVVAAAWRGQRQPYCEPPRQRRLLLLFLLPLPLLPLLLLPSLLRGAAAACCCRRRCLGSPIRRLAQSVTIAAQRCARLRCRFGACPAHIEEGEVGLRSVPTAHTDSWVPRTAAAAAAAAASHLAGVTGRALVARATSRDRGLHHVDGAAASAGARCGARLHGGFICGLQSRCQRARHTTDVLAAAGA